jgi:hypothetical protein
MVHMLPTLMMTSALLPQAMKIPLPSARGPAVNRANLRLRAQPMMNMGMPEDWTWEDECRLEELGDCMAQAISSHAQVMGDMQPTMDPMWDENQVVQGMQPPLDRHGRQLGRTANPGNQAQDHHLNQPQWGMQPPHGMRQGGGPMYGGQPQQWGMQPPPQGMHQGGGPMYGGQPQQWGMQSPMGMQPPSGRMPGRASRRTPGRASRADWPHQQGPGFGSMRSAHDDPFGNGPQPPEGPQPPDVDGRDWPGYSN